MFFSFPIRLFRFKRSSDLATTRSNFAVSASISAGLGLGLGLLGPLTGRAETAFLPAVASGSAFNEGEWCGVVSFNHEATRFSLESKRLSEGGTWASIRCAAHRANLTVVSSGDSHLTLTIDPVTGERLEGNISGDSFVGYYHAPTEPETVDRTFPFRATRQTTVSPRSEVRSKTDFGGEWILSLKSTDGRTRTVTALIAHGREKIYLVWREADGTRRYLMGQACSSRFAAEEISHGPGLVLGRSDPVFGVINGELVEPSGRTAFVARRKDARRIANLAGVD